MLTSLGKPSSRGSPQMAVSSFALWVQQQCSVSRRAAAYFTISSILIILMAVDALFRPPSGLLFPLSLIKGRAMSHGTGKAAHAPSSVIYLISSSLFYLIPLYRHFATPKFVPRLLCVQSSMSWHCLHQVCGA